MTARLAVSLPGAIPSGTMEAIPNSDTSERQSITGVAAASSVVRPFSSSRGLPAIPSLSNTTYFIISLLFLLVFDTYHM